MTPCSEAAEIKHRNELFQYFQKIKTTFPLKNYLLRNVSTYWEFTLTRYKIFSLTRIIWWGILKYFGINSKFNFVKQGILSTVKVMTILNDYLLTLPNKEGVYQKQYTEFQQLLNHKRLRWWQKEKEKQTFSYFKLARYDYLLRGKATNELQRLCQLLYELDSCISVGNTANEKGFTWAETSEESRCYLHIQNLYHPELTNPVSNTIHMDSSQNMFFLTGANMAGKSTFMKSVGIAIYLAHAGFPIPAQKMKFAVMDGMYTSINISDNVNAGYSHFFAEVIRVKTVAQELNRGKKLMIIMDELFKGTNVKDAYDATFAITSAFASTRQSLFLISTHIIETANELQKQHNDIQFQYFPARIEGDKSVYSYQLTKGITTDRYGMVIINHEKVIETIEKASHL